MPDPGPAKGWCQHHIFACSVISDVLKGNGPFTPVYSGVLPNSVSGWKLEIPKLEGQMLSILRRVGAIDRFSGSDSN